MLTLLYHGSTSNIFEFGAEKVLKVLRQVQHDEQLNAERLKGHEIEIEVYRILGEHKYILPHYGIETLEGCQGLALAKADGSLQDVLDGNRGSASLACRRRWCVQAAEAVAYIHDRGVLHSDLRPDNFLVRGSVLQLSDFNGAVCRTHGLDGQQLPDGGFWNLEWETTVHTDIFALGSVVYSILTEHWPFCEPGQLVRTSAAYEDEVNDRFSRAVYPEVAGLEAGDVILRCWKGQYDSARDIAKALKIAFKNSTG
ncbi:kinase [Microdochium trichocladiopsis]|uniref:EKC/KEOPS complex subunit BUD32 n=1 Tax=Microdochium trichocladiopsis TaxID=1682393 RepID=A0A9P8XPV7_9PEZI|nr:kinase [Microdochium trichocladiopsis]KAH7009399.1 kinase [Microdochium trichocladiopsis]